MEDFLAQFKEPSTKYRPFVRWWWPGLYVEKAELLREIKELDKNFFGGVEIQAFLFGVPGEIKQHAEQVHRFAPHPYYYEMVETILEAAKKRDMTVDLTIGSAWPPGSSTVSKDDSLKTLLMGTKIVKGPLSGNGKPFEMAVPPFQLPPYYKFKLVRKAMGHILEDFYGDEFQPVATVAIRPWKKREKLKFVFPKAVPLDGKTVQDLTDSVDEDGILHWDVPPGTWQVFTIYAGPSGMKPMNEAKSKPGARSLVVDHFNTPALERYLDGHLKAGEQQLKPYMGNTLRALFTDSLEIASEWFWTPDFFDEFEKRRGYDVRPFLPTCFVPNRDNQFLYVVFQNEKPCYEFKDDHVGERVRRDWLQTLSDLWAERYCAGVRAWAEKSGYPLQHRIQAYGIHTDLLKAWGYADIPETEQLFAGGILDFQRLATSAALLYDKSLVTSESMVWHYRDHMTTPLKWKVAADRLFISGINQMIYHGLPYYPPEMRFPGYDAWNWASSNFNRDNAFFQYFNTINHYVARAQYLMQLPATRPSCKVAIYYPYFNYDYKFLHDEELVGGVLPGFDAPRPKGIVVWWAHRSRSHFDRITQYQQELGAELTAHGYNYLHINEEKILEGTVEAGKFRVGQVEVDALIFPDIEAISRPLAEKLREIARAGVTVIFLGQRPDRQPGYLDYKTNDQIVREILQEGTGKYFHFKLSKSGLAQFLREDREIQPGAWWTPVDPGIQYIHKRTATGDIYYFRSGNNFVTDLTVKVAQEVLSPPSPYLLDLWDGSVNSISKKSVTSQDAGNGVTEISLALTFQPYEAKVILFPKSAIGAVKPAPAPRTTLTRIPLTGWSLHVEQHVPDHPAIIIDREQVELADWRDDKELRYLSGVGTYSTEFEIPPTVDLASSRVIFQATKVYHAAMVLINEEEHPTALLVPPYELDLTGLVHPGKNALQIILQGPNRNCLVGFGKRGLPGYRGQRKKQLMPMGLIGPVSVDIWD